MRTRLDASELDRAALSQHRDFRDQRPRTRRPSSGPDLTRRHRVECRFAEVLACRTPEELEELERQRTEDEAREPIENGIEGARL